MTSNNSNHSMHSVTSQRLQSWMQETLRFARLSTWSRSSNARCLNHCSTGVIYCVCGRLMTKDSAENRKYISAILDTFSTPNFYIRKNRPHRSQVWKITRDVKITLRRINLQRNAVKRSTTASTIDTSATKLSGNHND